ncbi:hypothetical protein CYLTODRAFT_480573, partial [Cylindrobasidium torrendii FP15055 ss-10]
NPHGVTTATRVTLPLIADLQASRKTSGSLSHSAEQFCWFCLCVKSDLDELDDTQWTLRTGVHVRQQARDWFNAKTKTLRNSLASENGVRWTPLHRLPYWDPVKHVILGFMHNWLEGVLQHQLRAVWGIGRNSSRAREAKDKDEDKKPMDIDEPPGTPATVGEPPTPSSRGSPTPTPETPHASTTTRLRRPLLPPDVLDHDEEDNSDEEDGGAATDEYEDPGLSENDAMSDDGLHLIRQCISTVLLPTWVHRPPSNLGEASHGKLKAADYLSLFAIIFPLSLPEVHPLPGVRTNKQQQLEMFYHLAASTFIVTDFKTSEADADIYTYHYVAYRKDLQRLFPATQSVPNHHYAMHNAALMKHWGPLPSLSEFPGERLNGIFQKVKTNKHLSDISLTMMRQTARNAHFQALQSTSPHLQSVVGASALGPTSLIDQPWVITDTEEAKMLGNAPLLDLHTYMMILNFLNSSGRPLRDYRSIPHPTYDSVLPRAARVLHHATAGDRTFSRRGAHRGNSNIEFISPAHWSGASTGYIEEILAVPLHGTVEVFFIVRPHIALADVDVQKTPYAGRPLLRVNVVEEDTHGPELVLQYCNIRSHIAVWERPAGTYGITRRFLLISCGLNRRRR